MLYERLVLEEKEKIFSDVNEEKINLINKYINEADSTNINDSANAILEILTQKEVNKYLENLEKNSKCVNSQ